MKNIDDILAMAQNVQNELQKAQANLDNIEVEGAAGCGLVKVKASAKGRILGIQIDDSLMQPSEKQMLDRLRRHFALVRHAKPPASRKGSSELYVVATGFRSVPSKP